MRHPDLIFKIASAEAASAWRTSGSMTGMPIDERDGYLHFSTADQLGETLRLYFSGQAGLALLAVRTGELGKALRWEPSRGGQLFPHIYGTLSMSAVVHEASIDVGPDGAVKLPGWVR